MSRNSSAQMGSSRTSVYRLAAQAMSREYTFPKLLGVHKGVEQGPVAPGEADQGVVDGGVPVRVELHGLAYYVSALGTGPPSSFI